MTTPDPPRGSIGLLLVTAEAAVVVPLTAKLAVGGRGGAIRRLDLPPASDDIRDSAAAGAACAGAILRRERYLDRDLVIRFATASDLVNIRGRSADLGFALAVVVGLLPRMDWPPLAATGRLEPEGGVAAVEAVGAKLAASLAALPPGGVVFYPGANETDVTADLRARAAACGVRLLAVNRLEEALRALGLGLSRTWLDTPFRGLEPFGFEHAAIFFGREREIEELGVLWQRRRDQGQPAVLVEGPSGAGKSSLVLAGLLPALGRRATAAPLFWAVLRPGDLTPAADPAEERRMLAASLGTAWSRGDEGGLGADGGTPPPLDVAGLAAWLAAQPRAAGGAGFLLICDQLEGWFVSPLHPETRAVLFSLLAGLAANGIGLIATITTTALPALGRHPALAACFGVEGRYALGPPQEAASLQAIIHGPAQAAGLRYEAGLEAELFAAAGHGGPDVLPLLELLLTELHERRDPAANLLRFADYHAAGGLEGVVSSRAESVFAAATVAERDSVPELLWKLMTAGMILPRDFPPPDPMPRLLDAFRTRRLLVAAGDGAEATGLRLAHEALLRHWQRAVAAREAASGDIRLWQDLTREAGQWQRGERALIPAGPQLQAAAALLDRRAGRWSASEQPVLDYVRASLTHRGRRRLLAAAALGVPALAVAGFGARAGAEYIAGLYLTRIRFAGVTLTGPDYTVAAAPYLHRHGLFVRDPVPERALAVIRGNLGLYGGRAAAPKGGGNVLTAQADPAAAPIGFTLALAQPVRAIRLLRTALWADTGSGVTHPAWRAEALDAAGRVIATTGETLLRGLGDIPGRWLALRPVGGAPIAALRLSSDFRLDGRPFAGFQAALIEEIDLVH